MSRPTPLAITLVPPLSNERPAWALETLRDHLELAGHHVRVTPRAAVAPDLVGADVVHCFGVESALGLDDPAGRPLLVTPPTDLGGASLDATAPVLASAASVLVRSTRAQEQVHRLGVPWFRTRVLPVAVDVETYSRLGDMAHRTHRCRAVAEVSGPADGLEDVVAAVSRLEGVELVVLVGPSGGPPATKGRVAGLRTMVRDAGMSERCLFVTPRSDGERAWWLRSGHVALAVPHVPAGAGVDFAAQAMACGTPVVATPVDALPDVVVHGVTGFLVGVGQPPAIARALHAVLDDEFSVESYGLAASDRARSRFAWPRVAHEFVGVYRRVAAPEAAEPDSEGAPTDADDPADDVEDQLKIAPLVLDDDVGVGMPVR